MVLDAAGQRPFIVFAPVQTDKTKESMAEVLAELQGILGDRPVTEAELGKVKEKRVLELPGTWETNSEVAAAVIEIERFDLGDDYFDRYPGRVRALSQAQVSAAAKEILRPGNLIWVVIGDRNVFREERLVKVKMTCKDGVLTVRCNGRKTAEKKFKANELRGHFGLLAKDVRMQITSLSIRGHVDASAF